jgi:hypothetical protein
MLTGIMEVIRADLGTHNETIQLLQEMTKSVETCSATMMWKIFLKLKKMWILTF